MAGSRMQSERRMSKRNKSRIGGITASSVDKDDEVGKLVRQFNEFCQVTVSEEGHIDETLMGLDNWNFDAMQVCDMIGRNALPIVFCRFVAIYDFVEVLKVDPELLCNFAKKIQAGYSTSTRFNGYARAIDMVQSMHYFLMRGMGKTWSKGVVDMSRYTWLFIRRRQAGQTSDGSFSAVSTYIFAGNTRWEALNEIYKRHTLLHCSELNTSRFSHSFNLLHIVGYYSRFCKFR